MIRIVVATMPQLLREIVIGALADQADMEVVGETSNRSDLPRMVQEKNAEIVIAACDDSEVARLGRYVNCHAPATLLAITDEGKRGLIYELWPRRVDLGQLTPSAMVTAVREALGRYSVESRTD